MRGFNRTQLKTIAICAMVCDHVAWGFLDLMNPISQILHIFGRFTLPIMCFFVAEGFRKTTNQKKYIGRMISFWLISIIPFYLFFHDEYQFRQNIIFDLLLGLLVLAILNTKKLKKWQKAILVLLLLGTSCCVGGWILLPTIYILIFYYAKDFKHQAIWFCGVTITLVVVLGITLEINYSYPFMSFNWRWYECLYFLGFMLPLLILRKYNGKKGQDHLSRYFFYLFYPAHFLVLFGIKTIIAGISFAMFYIGMHFLAIALILYLMIRVLMKKASTAQSGFIVLAASGLIYNFGFLVEITSVTVDGVYAAIKMEYFGEVLLILAFTWFLKDFCHREIPKCIYFFELVVSVLVMWSIYTVQDNHIFYKSMEIDLNGPLPRIVLEYGIGFYLVIFYFGIACITAIILTFSECKSSFGVAKKRARCMLYATIAPWLAFLLKPLGLTGGYEVPFLGIFITVGIVGATILKYGYFDSVSVASENALNHGKEGMLVIDLHNKVLYFNNLISQLFGNVSEHMNIKEQSELKEIFDGTIKAKQVGNTIYEMRIEPLSESGYTIGYLLWVIDMTKHYERMNLISENARKDALTGICNRDYYEIELGKFIDQKRNGAMFMLDLDNFKDINDTFGHQAGDEVLILFANSITEITGKDNFSCRIGGDEFSIFIKDVTDEKQLLNIANQLIYCFKNSLSSTVYNNIISMSIGIALCKAEEMINFKELYSRADKALYLSKNNGKDCCSFYSKV